MIVVIVPNALRDAINARLDAAYLDCPQAAIERDAHYHQLLEYFNEHGKLPEFKITKNQRPEDA